MRIKSPTAVALLVASLMLSACSPNAKVAKSSPAPPNQFIISNGFVLQTNGNLTPQEILLLKNTAQGYFKLGIASSQVIILRHQAADEPVSTGKQFFYECTIYAQQRMGTNEPYLDSN